MKRRQPSGNRSLAIVVFLGAGVLLARGALADSEELARKHAAKANQLAAKNRCRGAIFEFTRALKTLKDPTLLFNRAECFRKVGRDDEAITDYEEFLTQLPQAPNRAAVEARIASLRGAKAGAAAGTRGQAPSVPASPPPPLLKPGDALPPPAAAAGASTAKPGENTAVAAPAPKAANKPAAAPMAAPAAKASPFVAPTPLTPPAKPAEKAAGTPAAVAKPAEKTPATAPAPETKPVDKAAPAGRRAERWTD